MWRKIIITTLIFSGLISLIKGCYNAIESSQDFQWSGAKVLFQKENPYAFFLDEETRDEYFILAQAPNYSIWGYPIIFPYSVLEWEQAKIAWLTTNILLSFFVVVLIFRLGRSDSDSYYFLVTILLLFSSTSYRTAISNGQHGILVLFFFLLSLCFLRNKILSALFLSMAWFKYSLTIPLSIFFLQNKKSQYVLGISVSICFLLTAMLSFYTESEFFSLFFGPILSAIKSTGSGHLDVFSVFSTAGFDIYILPFIASSMLMFLGYLAMVQSGDVLEKLSVLSMLSCCTVFHLQHDMIILVIPLIYYFMKESKTLCDHAVFFMILYIWLLDRLFIFLYGFFSFEYFVFWQRIAVFYASFIFFLLSRINLIMLKNSASILRAFQRSD